MTKADIVNEIAKNTGIEKVTVQKTVEALMETVKDSKVITFISGVLEASSSRKEPRKQHGISPRIQLSLFLPIIFQRLSRLKPLLPK